MAEYGDTDRVQKDQQYTAAGASTGEQIPGWIRRFVLRRDGQTCQFCGAVNGDSVLDYPAERVCVVIAMLVEKTNGGSDQPENLRTLCQQCYVGFRSFRPKRLAPRSRIQLLTLLRKASVVDQRAVMEWLDHKFTAQRRRIEGFKVPSKPRG